MDSEQQLNMQLMQIAQRIDFERCDNCDGTIFEPVYRLKQITPILSPIGQTHIIPEQIMRCVNCFNIYEVTE
jgi:hypothetical protein